MSLDSSRTIRTSQVYLKREVSALVPLIQAVSSSLGVISNEGILAPFQRNRGVFIFVYLQSRRSTRKHTERDCGLLRPWTDAYRVFDLKTEGKALAKEISPWGETEVVAKCGGTDSNDFYRGVWLGDLEGVLGEGQAPVVRVD